MRTLLMATVFFAKSAAGQQSPAEIPPEVSACADMVLFNGKVLTADESFTIAEAVAIRDGKFLAVGPNQRILKMAGPATKKIDLRGNTAVPGFIDTHDHLGDYALAYMFFEETGGSMKGR